MKYPMIINPNPNSGHGSGMGEPPKASPNTTVAPCDSTDCVYGDIAANPAYTIESAIIKELGRCKMCDIPNKFEDCDYYLQLQMQLAMTLGLLP